jgi:dienelactone hydrolase
MRMLLAMMAVLSAAPVLAKPVVKPLEWGFQGAVFNGYVVYDDYSAAIRPGIAMVPNWMGVNDAAVEKAKALAGKDYVVLLVDMYGKDVRPKNAKEAAAAAQAVYADREQMRNRIVWAVEALRAQGRIAPLDFSKLGAVGFCFGGSTVLELARAGALEASLGTSVSGVVSFHGGLSTPVPAKKGDIRTSVLVLNGADDTSVSADDIAAFGKEMDGAAVDWKLVNFPGARHCFAEADANSPPNCVYHEPSATKGFALMREFFEERFKHAPAQ